MKFENSFNNYNKLKYSVLEDNNFLIFFVLEWFLIEDN